MGDITWLGNSYAGVPWVTLPQTGGGEVEFQEYNASLGWMGNHPVKLTETPYSTDILLSATTYSDFINAETPTTATDIYTSKTAGTFTANLAEHDYIILWHWDIVDAAADGATLVYFPYRSYGDMIYVVHKRPYGLANFASETPSYNYCTALYTAAQYYLYYNSSSNVSWTTTMYGIYGVGVASTLGSTTSASPTVTVKTPKISARCNKSYFATARRGEVDQTKTTIKIRGDVYQVDFGTSPLSKIYMDAIHMYSNPIS